MRTCSGGMLLYRLSSFGADFSVVCLDEGFLFGTFFSGFFIDLRKSMTAGEIKEHFSFDSDMSCIESAEKAFRKYIETT